jgi:hypothetical protein
MERLRQAGIEDQPSLGSYGATGGEWKMGKRLFPPRYHRSSIFHLRRSNPLRVWRLGGKKRVSGL